MKTSGKTKVISITIVIILLGLSLNSFGEEPTVNGSEVENLSSTDLHLFLGIQNELKGNYDSAIVELNESIRLNPKNAEAYNIRGVIYTKLIKYRKALKDFNQAIGIKPKYAEAYNHRGIVYYCLEEYTMSVDDYSKALELNPEYGKAYFNRGISEFMQDDEYNAMADMTKASSMNIKEAVDFLSKNSSDKN